MLCALTVLGAGVMPRVAEAQNHVLIVTGLGAEAKYVALFKELGKSMSEAMHTRFGVADSAITWLGEDSSSTAPRYRGLATRENIERTLARIADRAAPTDQVVIVLVGHGSGEGPQSKFSIPGPDLTTEDFARLLARFGTRRVGFVNLSTASGDMLPLLSGPNRVIITATKTAFERNESQFARYFTEALAKDVADSDKDGRVSLLEAFAYASTETKRYYEDATKLMTEHALLDDDADGKGNLEPTGRNGADGLLARRFFLNANVGGSRVAMTPELATLYDQRFDQEEAVEAHKRKKPQMAADAYDAELERLLLALSRTSRDIRKLEGRK